MLVDLGGATALASVSEASSIWEGRLDGDVVTDGVNIEATLTFSTGGGGEVAIIISCELLMPNPFAGGVTKAYDPLIVSSSAAVQTDFQLDILKGRY
jgi:hypothetical protein